MGKKDRLSRDQIYTQDFPEVAKVSETLYENGVDPAVFLRAFSLNHFMKGNFADEELRKEIPGLRQTFPQLGRVSETLTISTGLVQLKIADLVIEGAEPYGFWKSVFRIEPMDQPKLTIPKATTTDLFANLADIRSTDGAAKKLEGGQITPINFDVSDNKGYYALAAQVTRNWLRDNNFRAIELYLKQVGEAWYFAVGKFLWSQCNTLNTVTNTKANLYGSSQTRLQALINVIENQIPGVRFTPDTIIIHPQDAYATKVEQWGTGGPIPLISSLYFDKDHANGTEPGFAQLLNVNSVWRTPWATQGTVLIFQKDKNMVVGLRQDLEFEDFGDTVMGLQGAVTSMRFDQQLAFANAGFSITSF